MGLSYLGIFHTAIGIIAIVAAVTDFIRKGKIDLNTPSGKIYFYFTLITSLTALGLSKHGGFNPGHIFSVFIIVLILTAYFLHSKKQGNNRARFFENFLLSFSFFLSLVPTVNETFTRVPIGHPLAKAPTDPVIGQTLLGLFVLFVVGSVFQFREQRKINRSV
ncbi:hypothetical protein ACQWU4_18600 [Chryseobacterium sp. MIQD13]|uniref:hypothetical protein n=1 Tax=Chryseobacterium sp. MIQD13 TaxID=3422310 RepID=UPI003D2CE5FB